MFDTLSHSNFETRVVSKPDLPVARSAILEAMHNDVYRGSQPVTTNITSTLDSAPSLLYAAHLDSSYTRINSPRSRLHSHPRKDSPGRPTQVHHPSHHREIYQHHNSTSSFYLNTTEHYIIRQHIINHACPSPASLNHLSNLNFFRFRFWLFCPFQHHQNKDTGCQTTLLVWG